MKIYRGTDGDNAPVECECDVFGYPNRCTTPDGESETMYVNTHFRTEAEAWDSIVKSATAGVKMSGHAVADNKARLRDVERAAADDCERFAAVMRGYDEFKRSPSPPAAEEVRGE